MCSLAVIDRRQAEGCNFSRNTMQSNKFSLLCDNNGQVYRAEEPRFL